VKPVASLALAADGHPGVAYATSDGDVVLRERPNGAGSFSTPDPIETGVRSASPARPSPLQARTRGSRTRTSPTPACAARSGSTPPPGTHFLHIDEEGATGSNPSIAIGPEGEAWVAYHAGAELRWASKASLLWKVTKLGSTFGPGRGGPSGVFLSPNLPRIAYHGAGGKLRWAIQ